MGIGEQLKVLRKSKSITLTEVSEKIDLSVGFLSNLERDLTSPTIDVLHKICNVLNITINDILQPDSSEETHTAVTDGSSVKPETFVVRGDDRKLLFQENDTKLTYFSMTKGHTDVKVSAMRITGNELYKFDKHDHDELGIVISGSLEIQLEGKSIYLYPGDTIYIKAGYVHAGRKASDEECLSYWIKLSSEINDLKK